MLCICLKGAFIVKLPIQFLQALSSVKKDDYLPDARRCQGHIRRLLTKTGYYYHVYLFSIPYV